MVDYMSFGDSNSFWFGLAAVALTVNFFIIMPLFKFVCGFCFTFLRQLSKQVQSDQTSEKEPFLGVAGGNGLIRDQSKSAKLSAESSCSSDDRPNREGEIEAILPKLGQSDYYTEPQIQELADKERAEPGYCRHVKDFVVGRRGYGSIKFLGESDVQGLDLESVIQINEWDVIVYLDDSGRTPFGQVRNKPVVVTNLNMKCINKKTGNQIFNGPRWEEYEQLRKKQVANNQPTYWGLEGLRQFTYQSLVDVTQDFSLDCRVSFDRLGDVFRGQFFNPNECIAIKRLEPCPLMSLGDFLDEVLLLSQANHPNLTKLIGYCAEKHNRLLVYEHVPRGTLENQLYGLYTCFDWDIRMEIALGVARALEYLQNSMKPQILHCYIDPSNVWLNEEYAPKLCGFGVVRMFPSPLDKFGSYDYALPDYMLAKKVTIEADIYGFGIFLLEIITGKRGKTAIFLGKDGLPQKQSDWARDYLKDKQNLVEVVDRRLEGEFDKEKLHEVCDIIEKCLEEQPSSRPPIADIVARMNYLAT
ncbi:hypothetical protein KSS87_009977 [Heliosperma pusillum]|nr:hypothetical protein KSS87_009977 [Heliosperma pusillum]